MIRRIIVIDENKCNGCGACAAACHEGAIGMVNGKARLLHEHYCDGLGDCLPACPANAITFEERDAPAYDEAAVQAAKREQAAAAPCPSYLRHWPVQIKLAPVNAPFLRGADVLVAATCTAYAYGDFHARLIKDRVVLVGCSKLDGVDYSEKLCAMFANNDIRSIVIARMQVPCCIGLERMVHMALQRAGKDIPCETVIITTDGRILEG